MIRKIITIDQSLCNGCGLCARACHEGAIGMVDGKAVLLREDYCDGLGDCLPACPMGAITFTHREAPAYNEQAAKASQQRNWPVQLKLAPMESAGYQDRDLLVAADCCAYAYAHFHTDLLRGKAVLIGCPKLDGIDYSMKLMRILQNNAVRSVTVARMEVPCCGGLEYAVKKALQDCGKQIPCRVVTVTCDGQLK